MKDQTSDPFAPLTAAEKRAQLLSQARGMLSRARTANAVRAIGNFLGTPSLRAELREEFADAYALARAIAACPVAAALEAAATRLRQFATAARLPSFSFSISRAYSTELGWYDDYNVAAKPAGALWTNSEHVSVNADTLPEAEAAFVAALATYQAEQALAVYETEPTRFGNQQLASYAALAREAA